MGDKKENLRGKKVGKGMREEGEVTEKSVKEWKVWRKGEGRNRRKGMTG